jgi:nicotinamide-nucleotide amidase
VIVAVDHQLAARAERILAFAKQKGWTIVTAESCTCGMLATLLSKAEGASQHLHGGFVTYTKQNKTAALGVPRGILDRQGAVCEPVARAMAEGALTRSPADLSIAVTGVAGPGTDDDGNPVGLVHLAATRRGQPTLHVKKSYGDLDRETILQRAMLDALQLLQDAAER